MKFRYSH